MGTAAQRSDRTAIKKKLYLLLWQLEEAGPLATPGSTDDPAEEEEICDDDLQLLVDTYEADRDRQLGEIQRAMPLLEKDLQALAIRNQANRGTLGFRAADLLDSANADLSFGVYPKETALKYARLLGWTITQEFVNCSDCQGPYVESLWVPPTQGRK